MRQHRWTSRTEAIDRRQRKDLRIDAVKDVATVSSGGAS